MGLILFCILGVLLECAAGLLLVYRICPSNAARDVLMQGMFRTNLVLVGLPIATGVYEERLGPFPIIFVVMIPVYNILGTVIFKYFRSQTGSIKLGEVARGIALNSLVICSVMGILAVILNITLPFALERTVRYLSQAATAVALLILCASLRVGEIKGNQLPLAAGLIMRLAIFPAVFVTAVAAIGYRNIELLTVLMVFGCPLGTVVYVIAQKMESDAELAAELVVFTTTAS